MLNIFSLTNSFTTNVPIIKNQATGFAAKFYWLVTRTMVAK